MKIITICIICHLNAVNVLRKLHFTVNGLVIEIFSLKENEDFKISPEKTLWHGQQNITPVESSQMFHIMSILCNISNNNNSHFI